MAIHQILTQQAASITDLKRDPMGIAHASEDGAVAILNRNQPAFYCVTPALFEYFQELAEDAVNDNEVTVFILSVGKRDRLQAYENARNRTH